MLHQTDCQTDYIAKKMLFFVNLHLVVRQAFRFTFYLNVSYKTICNKKGFISYFKGATKFLSVK